MTWYEYQEAFVTKHTINESYCKIKKNVPGNKIPIYLTK